MSKMLQLCYQILTKDGHKISVGDCASLRPPRIPHKLNSLTIKKNLLQHKMGNPDTWRCQNCGNVGLEDGDDGFFYCTQCNSQAEDFMDTGVADEDFLDQTGNPYGGLYSARHTRRVNSSVVKAEPLSQPLDDFSPYYEPFSQSQAKTEDQDPTGLKDFAFDGRENDEDYYGWIRLRYVMGLQRMIDLQCEALVTEFKVTPLICGLAGTVWLRFLAGTQVLNDDCADHSFDLNESEIPQQGEPLDKLKTPLKSHAPNYAKYDPQALKAWFKSLKKIIPLSYTLAVSFLACHLAREAVLPTDMDSDAAAEQGLHCGRTVDQKRPRYNEECSSSPCREKKFRRPSSCEETFLEDDHQNSQNGDHFGDSSHDSKNSEVNDQGSAETFKNEAINRMKLDMEEKRFCYIPPRKNPKRFDYLHYVRKQDDGAYTYVAHADYYIMLRTCSRVAQVEIRCMHIGVLSFERRLAWLEKRIDHCLHLTPPIISCEYCTDMVPENTTDAETTDMVPENTTDADTIVEESIGLSNLNI